MISLTNHDSSEGEQWGRYNLPRYNTHLPVPHGFGITHFKRRPAKRIPSPESLPLRHETKQPGGTMGKQGQNEGKKTAPNVESTWKIHLKPEIYEYIYI